MKKIILTLALLLVQFVGQAQYTAIPDPNFEQALIDLGYDNAIDGQVLTANISGITSLYVPYDGIYNLTGIEDFAALQILVCNNNYLIILNVSGLTSLQELVCNNNQLTSLNVSGLTNLQYFRCDYNQLPTLNVSGLTNLKNLYCDNNQLTILNLSGCTNLQTLRCSDNQLPALDVSGLNNLQSLLCGFNQLSTLDVSGLTNLNNLLCSNNQLTSLDVSGLTNLTFLDCGNNQLTSLNLSGLTNLQTLYCYNNQLPTLDVSGLTNLQTLYCSYNQLPSLNVSGLTHLQTVLCDHNLLTSLDFSSCLVFQNLSCSYNSLTYINIKNGNPIFNTNTNYTYSWGANPNLTFVCADEGELTAVNQILTQSTNVNTGNVVFNTYCSFNPNGKYNTIAGQIKLDANNNGCDATDAPPPMVKVKINDGTNTGATFTDVNGNYKCYTQAGSFNITPEIEHPTWFTFSPTTATIPFADANNNTATQNFCIAPNGSHQDLEIVMQPITAARPGFEAVYKIDYRNKGNLPVSGSLNFNFNDDLLDFVSATVAPNTQNTGVLTWNYSNLMPFESSSFYVTLYVNAPTATPPVTIGTALNFATTINPIATDENQGDNQIVLNQTVVGSFDPNEITCLEGDLLPTTEIGNYLHYGITFENTGNYPAENVVVKDIIDTTKYDVNSIQLLSTSHPVYTRITGNVVEFIFQNINLAGAIGTPAVGGHGDVLFKIKSLSTLVNGNMVTKSAKIYFDYNAPIATNLSQTTYQMLSNTVHQLDASISVYPNPASAVINITSKFNIKSVELYNIQGRILETNIENAMETKLDISEKQSGTYFLKINSENGSKVEKILKK